MDLGAIALAVAIALGNLGYWFWAMTRGSVRFEAWVQARYDIVIGRTVRGHWHIGPDSGSSWRRFGIEMLEFAYYVGALALWIVLMGASMLLLSVVAR